MTGPLCRRDGQESSRGTTVSIETADARSLVATVPAVAMSADEPNAARGQLLATRLVLEEALSRLPDDQLADLQSALDALVTGLRDEHGDSVPPAQAHIIDELEAISLRLRYRGQPLEHPADGGEPAYIGVCMRCEHFPIDIGAACPQCQTDRWVTAVRS